jgi:hypothetical protein
MRNVVPVESVGENFVINFSGTQFQVQGTSRNLLRKCCPLGQKNLLENVFTEEKLDEIEAKLEHTPQK